MGSGRGIGGLGRRVSEPACRVCHPRACAREGVARDGREGGCGVGGRAVGCVGGSVDVRTRG